MSHARDRGLTAVVVGVGTLLAAATLARRPLTRTEVRTFRLVNGLPDGAYPLVWVPMQYGTYGTVPLATAVAFVRRRPHVALAIAGAGTAAWVLAKAAKPIVDRGRPASLVDNVSLRGAEEGDLGFPSGHATVSAALTVVTWPYASGPQRAALAVLAGFVPVARMYVGAHLPLDAVGGSALGLAIGSAVNLAIRRTWPSSMTGRMDADAVGAGIVQEAIGVASADAAASSAAIEPGGGSSRNHRFVRRQIT